MSTMDNPGNPALSDMYGTAPPASKLEGAICGLAAGAILGFSTSVLLPPDGPTTEESQRRGMALALAGMAAGAGIGLGDAGRRRQRFVSEAANRWRGWRPFRVVRKRAESQEITSFHLAPVDGMPIPSFQPGQFLTIQLSIPGQSRPVVRTYSLSDDLVDGAAKGAHYRLSIKREPPPRGQDVPPGLASSWMHDHVREGSTILCRPPSGAFVLHRDRDRPIALVSNGVGITPMMTIASAAKRLRVKRPVWFIHGARDGVHQAFAGELRALAEDPAKAAGSGTSRDAVAPLNVHIVYSRPRPEDEGCYQSKGYVDAPLLQHLLPADADLYLCGSPPFMDGILGALRERRDDLNGVFYEVFSRAPRPPQSGEGAGPAELSTVSLIRFNRSDREAMWSEESESLLAFAEGQGLHPSFACRAGVCGTCRCRVVEGEVATTAAPTAPLSEGEALICISRPASKRVVLDL